MAGKVSNKFLDMPEMTKLTQVTNQFWLKPAIDLQCQHNVRCLLNFLPKTVT